MLDSEYILTLLKISGIGRKTVASILSGTGFSPKSLTELRDVIDDACKNNKRLKVPELSSIESANQKAKEVLDRSQSERIELIPFGSKKYPKMLLNITDPPIMLYVKGDTASFNELKNIAIIGTREPTEYGEKCGELISRQFSENGFVVTSGLAKGCDAAAHRGCLLASGRTIAILGHGLHMVYPAKNRELAAKIIDNGGCLLSEYEYGIDPKPNFFVERDRLQSGLALGIFVIETGIKGGTMHAVNSCINESKPIACLKHPEKYLNHPKVQGNKMLITEKGAFPILEKVDIGEFIKILLKTEDVKVKNNSKPIPVQLQLFDP
jgi:DNA processing protein